MFLEKFLEKILFVAFFVSLLMAGMTGYDYYKSFTWPEAAATVLSARQTCLYSKGRSLSRESRHPFCDDVEAGARLVAEGFKPQNVRRLRIEAVYETAPGQKTQATLNPFLEDAGLIEPGDAIRIRYSPASPGKAELALAPNGWEGLIALAVAALSGIWGYFLARRIVARNVSRDAQGKPIQ